MKPAPILVVGAGPVGLTTALSLARAGLPVRLIDLNSNPTELSKALILWRRSLMMLDSIIPVERLSRLGQEARGAHFHDQGQATASLPFTGHGHALPAGLLIPQSRLERAFVDTLATLGVNVERATKLTHFTQSADSVQCTLETPQGTETVETPFLIGCDGAHSLVRHTLAVPFTGTSVAHRWLLGDIDIELCEGLNPNEASSPAEADVEDGWIYLNSSSEGALALFPIESGRYRIIVDAGPADSELPRQDPTVEELQTALFHRTRLQWRIVRSHWLADFRVSERQVAQYVHGRVLLAGDAAHLHSPAGGQGMNTGIQDALNLAWKVALAYEGQAGLSLLNTYQQERHPVAARVLRLSGRLLRAGMVTNPIARHLRDLVLSIALNVPTVRHLAAEALSEDDIHYLESALVDPRAGSGETAPGHAFPDVPIEIKGQERPSTDLLRGVRETRGTLILMPEADRAEWPVQFGGHPLSIRQQGLDFHDSRGLLDEALGLAPTEGLLLRPDGVIATRGNAQAAQEWLAQHIHL